MQSSIPLFRFDISRIILYDMFIMKENIGMFFDFDGTLWFGRYGEETLKELRRLAEKGIMLFLNTGRATGNLPQKEIAQIPFTALFCGGCVAVQNGEFLFRRDLTEEEIALAVEVTERFGLDTVYEGVKRNYLQSLCRDSFINGKKLGMAGAEFVEGKDMLDRTERPVSKLSVLKRFNGSGNAIPFPPEAKEILSRYFDVIDFPAYTECLGHGFGKDRMIRFAEERFRIPHENTYAFGDSFNDSPMLRYAAHSVAIGHAPQGVKDLVDFVTTEEENGVAQAIRSFGL